jgi:hypothetical protein
MRRCSSPKLGHNEGGWFRARTGLKLAPLGYLSKHVLHPVHYSPIIQGLPDKPAAYPGRAFFNNSLSEGVVLPVYPFLRVKKRGWGRKDVLTLQGYSGRSSKVGPELNGHRIVR